MTREKQPFDIMAECAREALERGADFLRHAYDECPALGRHRVLEPEQFATLRAIERRLNAGSDAMRDEGHRLGLILKALEDAQP